MAFLDLGKISSLVGLLFWHKGGINKTNALIKR